MIQKPRQFVITGRGAYHGGENVDHSIAEAINFGISDDCVLEYCQKFKACSCDPDKWKWATHRHSPFVLLIILVIGKKKNIFQHFNRVYSEVVKKQFTNSARDGKAEEDVEEEDEERPILKTVGKQKNVRLFPHISIHLIFTFLRLLFVNINA